MIFLCRFKFGREPPFSLFLCFSSYMEKYFLARFLMSFGEAPVQVLFDDYLEHKQYHVVESIQAPVRMIGRAALFEVEPKKYSAQEFLSEYLPLFMQPG